MMIEKPKILILEENLEQGEMVVEIINKIGKYMPVWVKNGEDALVAMKKHQRFLGLAENEIKCILLAVQMPDLKGIEFLSEFRQTEKIRIGERYAPVIILTEVDNLKIRRESIRLFVSGIIQKPIQNNEIEDILNRIVFEWDQDYLIERNRENSHKVMGMMSKKSESFRF